MNKDLQKYLENVIMPKNDLNDAAHNREHVNYVRRRSKKFASNIEGLNLDMVDTIAVYHDVGHSIDAKNHEMVSAIILASDENLRDYFNEKEIVMMAQAEVRIMSLEVCMDALFHLQIEIRLWINF